jgi:hypothetical protein
MRELTYRGAIWDETWAHAGPGLKSKLRTLTEALLSAGLVYEAYRRGGMELASDYAVKTAIGIVGALAAFMIIHLGFSWATAPRRVFYRQQDDIKKLRSSGGATWREPEIGDIESILANMRDECRRMRRKKWQVFTNWYNETLWKLRKILSGQKSQEFESTTQYLVFNPPPGTVDRQETARRACEQSLDRARLTLTKADIHPDFRVRVLD